MYSAASNGHLEIVKILIHSHADTNAADHIGVTPLYSAVRYGHLEIVKILIESHADINAADNFGVTPLRAASMWGHVKIEKMLRAAGTRSFRRSVVDEIGVDRRTLGLLLLLLLLPVYYAFQT